MTESDDTSIDPPSVSSWLLSFLSVRRSEYEEQFAETGEDATELSRALDAIERSAAELVLTGVLPPELATRLESFKPGDPATRKIIELLQYQIVHHRIEFDIAEDVAYRLEGVDKRVQLVTMLTVVLVGYTPSETAVKFFRRATTLFLAGYETESIIMCGAVLEAALRARFPDEMLTEHGMKPIFKRTSDFSIAQRLQFEEKNPIFNEGERLRIRDLLSWRNDSVHVQPDVTPSAKQALIYLTVLLTAIFGPREA